MSLPSPADLPNDWASVDFGGNWARLGPWAQGCGASISAAAQRVTLRVALGTPLAIQRSQAALRRLSRVKQKDIAMHTSIAAVVERPLTRRLLMVTAGPGISLAATASPTTPNTNKQASLSPPSPTLATSSRTG